MIVSLPLGSVELVTVATPLVRPGDPRMVDPLVKITVPVTPGGSVAVNVTDWFKADGLLEDVRFIVGVAFATIWVVEPFAGLSFVSPP